jgi:membrane fusion protein, multidrug efflux system
MRGLEDEPGSDKRRYRTLAIVVGIVLLALGTLIYWQRPDAGAPPAASRPADSEYVAGQETMTPTTTTPVDVQVVKPIRRDIAYSVTLPANVAPHFQATLYAKVSGYLKWIGPDKGDWVKKHDVVAIIDAPEVEEQYHQAVADYKIKKLTYERLAKVWAENPDVIAKQDVDVAQATYEGAKHQMEQREALRDYTKVRAPFAGIITARFADPGALIQIATSSATGAIPLFTLMDIETVRIYANVPQEDAHLVKPGATDAVLTVKELGGRTFHGVVTRSTFALDPSTRSLLVEVDLPNPDHALQPGTFGELTLLLNKKPNALVLPLSSIVSNGKGKSVFLVDQGRAKSVAVKTGITEGKWTEITEGLTGGEEVVVVGKSKLMDGTPLNPSPYNLPEGNPATQRFERPSSGSPSVQQAPPNAVQK